MDDRIETNRARWDELALLHATSYLADGPDAISDQQLRSFELDELGKLDGKHVCHLQCHIGGDSLSLARLGATVVGVDFSPTSIEIASQRTSQVGLGDRVRFVCATVDDAPRVLGETFDGVYTSWGVLCWLPSLDNWARSIVGLLRPGGWLYLAETHPYATAVRQSRLAYGGAEAIFDDVQGDYTDANAVVEHPQSWEWQHGVGEVVTALIGAGLRMEWLHEHPEAAWHLNDQGQIQPMAGGLWHQPGSTLPLSFSLRASKSED